jgi:Ca2+-binding RTX toxin-like protein
MAKITFAETPFGGFIYQGEPELAINNAHTKAVYTDNVTGDKIIITGENLTAQAGDDDLFASGTIEKVKLQRADGEIMLTVSDGHFNAEKLSKALDHDGVYGLYSGMLGGKDAITGSTNNDGIIGLTGDDLISGGKGNDTIRGGLGDDEMSGGNGSDTFVFYGEDKGHDVIKDFDIEGPVLDYLEISVSIESITKSGGGDDTLIHFDNGATVLLDGVEKADFVDYWNSLV